MKKFLILIFILSFFLVGCSNNNNLQNTEKENTNYNISRTITNETKSENHITDTEIKSALEETDIASFSTKIYTPNDSARQNNITLTCSKLNGTVVKSGETFSFCNTVGKATPEAGYEKADVFDKDGNTIKGYGGR